MKNELDKLRQEIDNIDNAILELLKKRSLCALSVLTNKVNATDGTPQIHCPKREQKIISRMCEINESPLDHNSITRIFKTIIEECRLLQQKKHQQKL